MMLNEEKEEEEEEEEEEEDSGIRTKYIKGKIDYTQKNSTCRLSVVDRDELVHHISECIKLTQKEYETWHDWEGKKIP